MEETFASMTNSYQAVDGITLCFPNKVYAYGREFSNLDHIRKTYDEIIQRREGRSVFLPTTIMEGAFTRKPKDYILARAINSRNGQVATLYLFFSSDYLRKIIDNPSLRRGKTSYYLVAKNGRVVVSNRQSEIGHKIALPLKLGDMKSGEGSFFLKEEEAGEQMISYAKLSGTDWISLIADPREELRFGVRNLVKLALFFTLFYVFVMLIGNVAIYRFIIRPIRNLSNGMDDVGEGAFIEIPLPKTENELRKLTEHFNRMSGKIEELIRRVREEESSKNELRMKVLYMQIGPHFLYNTLSSLKWMAILNKQSGIRKMTDAIMKIMAGVTYDCEKDRLTIEKELALLESYITIQQVRFSTFQVAIDVPAELMQYKIDRFLLQPFVENSILHGFQGRKEAGEIRITMRQEREKFLQVDIYDNGRGIEQSELEESGERLQTENLEGRLRSKGCRSEKDRVGIRNVEERIHLHYGNEYGVVVENGMVTGVHVRLLLPLIKGEEG
ncbi:MAG: histidine kinase [Lachnospiraceae bacterium]|nr:histidine kinase [Lachnospiraceae bacterium]